MIRKMSEIVKKAAENGSLRMAVAAAQDDVILQAVWDAQKRGIIMPVLVGSRREIQDIAERIGYPVREEDILDVPDKAEACMQAAALIRDGRADFLFKGMTDTSVIMRAVLQEQNGLRTGGQISQDLVLEIPGYDRLIHVTDAAMSIAPDLAEKAGIIQNAVRVANALGNDCPKVAALCAVEKVNPKMPCTEDAAELAAMNQRGEISGCLIGGPLALDNAVSEEAARHKGVTDPVAGEADILLVPDIEAGNMLAKGAEYFAGAKKAGVIMGARVPVALTSRATSAESKLYTIALAALITGSEK